MDTVAAQQCVVSVDDLGAGLWSSRLKQEVEARVPLRNVLFSLSRAVVSVEELPVRFLDARTDVQLRSLRPHAHSPVAWFRCPLVQLVLVSCLEYEDYKRDVRLRLKAMADTETSAPGQPELLFVYVRPPGAGDPAAKGPAKVFDAMRKDLNRRRERCVRLDPMPAEAGASALLGGEEFDRQLKEALRAAFEARAAAYAEEVRRLMMNRLDPDWSFSTLFLVKDSLAAMLESAGLLEDALREYSELEACYLEALQSGHLAQQPFGGKPAGEDEAALLWSPWAGSRQAASQPELPLEYTMRQALFASQARLLFKLHRHAEVAERGLKFVRTFGAILAERQQPAASGSGGGVPARLPEAWSFAGYVSLAAATSRLQAARADEKRKTDHLSRGAGRRGRLTEVRGQAPSSPPTAAAAAAAAGQDPASPGAGPASPAAAAAAWGSTTLTVKASRSSDPESAGSPSWQQRGQTQVEWQLGVLPSRPAAMAAAAAAEAEGAAAGRAPPGRDGSAAAPGSASLYCLLAQLYCAARAELLRLGSAAGLDVPKTAAAAAGLLDRHQQHAAAAATAAASAPAPAQAAAAAGGSGGQQAAQQAAAEEPPQLSEAHSASDLSQVDLNGSSNSNSSTRGAQQQRQRAQQADEQQQAAGAAAGVRLESAADVQPEGNGEAGGEQQLAASAAGVGAARSAAAPPLLAAQSQLQRLSLRPETAGGDAGSGSSTPHSASTHQSTLQDSHFDAGHALAVAAPPPVAANHAATGAAADAAAPLPSPRLPQNDLTAIERQVASALAERPSRAASSAAAPPAAKPAPAALLPADAAATSAAAAALPPWLVHWRLRVALSSQQLFTELFIELSEAAASCYSQCGHLRSAALLRADVADALVKAGSLQHAAELYDRQCRTFLREGWHALAARTLPKLAACQLATGNAGLAHTAAALLSLPAPFRGTLAERQAACQLLLQAAHMAQGLAGSRPLLPSSPGPAAAAAAAVAEPHLSLPAILSAAPPKAAVSRFFGRTGPGGAPLLAPPPRPVSATDEAGARAAASARAVGGGALCAAVGDVLTVRLEVDNQLPVALPLADVTLTLGVLQEMTVIQSPPRATSPSMSLAGTPNLRRAGSSLRLPPPASPASPLGDALRQLTLAPMEPAASQRYASEWQQVEELQCSLLAIHSSSSSGGSGSGSGASSGGGLQPLRGEVALPPGASVLTFLAAPVKRGLYKALHLQARLHQLPLLVAVHAPEPVWEQQQWRRQQGGAAGGAGGRGGGAAGGSLLTPLAGGGGASGGASEAPAGSWSAETILMQVEPAQPRVQLALVAAGGSLIAGQGQWLGLAVASERDGMSGASLALTWPQTHAADRLPALAAVPRNPTGVAPHHRAVQSVSGDMRLGSLGSSSSSKSLAASLGPAPPFIRPEHKAAVLLLNAPGEHQAGGCPGDDDHQQQQEQQQQQQQAEAQLLPAERPAGPAASWLLADGLQQHVQLPHVAEGRPVNIWWWVTAGEVAAPPELVHIAPPAPRHSSRHYDSRRLGLPADQHSPPAALLDLPASLEYLSGCQRCHNRVLPAAVRQPFSVHSVARELPSGAVAVQFTLTSNMAVPAQLAMLAVEPQPGFLVASNLLESMGLLPLTLAPFATLTAAFLLAPDASSASGDSLLPAKLQPSALVVEYSIHSRQQCSVAAAPLTAAGSSGQGQAAPTGGPAGSTPAEAAADAAVPQQTPAAEVLDLLGASSSSSSGRRAGSPTLARRRAAAAAAAAGSPTAATAAAAALSEPDEEDEEAPAGHAAVAAAPNQQQCCFRHLLTLEKPASDDDSSGTLVYVRLLGPFAATVGQPTTLCWRLERSGGSSGCGSSSSNQQQQQATRVSFEVQAEGDHWRPLGRRTGGVTLAGHDGAVATVEASWVPLAAGTLPVPTLSLQDVNSQEVFGLSVSNAITVMEAGFA